jgi:sugar phosphate isomerase/epimerase
LRTENVPISNLVQEMEAGVRREKPQFFFLERYQQSYRNEWDHFVRDGRSGESVAYVERLCVELHDNQLVFNVPTLLALREAVGPVVGANLDPSQALIL